MLTRVCHLCGATVPEKAWCETCVAAWPNRPRPETMTGDEKAAEIEELYGPLQVPFGLLHERFEAILGRPIFTHEFGMMPKEAFIEDARGATRAPTFREVVEMVPADKRVIVVMPDAEEAAHV